MQMKANFNFGTRNIEIRIYLENYSMWSLYSISGTYDFHSISISQPEFVEYSSHSSRNERFFRVDTFRIDRHILMKQFTVKTKYQINHIMTELNSNFTFDVSFDENSIFP